MNNSNLSEMVLDSQNQTIDFAEYELDETALECVNGGKFSDDAGNNGYEGGKAIGDGIRGVFTFTGGWIGGLARGIFG